MLQFLYAKLKFAQGVIPENVVVVVAAAAAAGGAAGGAGA
jgi:hypothetical protein